MAYKTNTEPSPMYPQRWEATLRPDDVKLLSGATFGDAQDPATPMAVIEKVNNPDSLKASYLRLRLDAKPGRLAAHLILEALTLAAPSRRSDGREVSPRESRRSVQALVPSGDRQTAEWYEKVVGLRQTSSRLAHEVGGKALNYLVFSGDVQGIRTALSKV